MLTARVLKHGSWHSGTERSETEKQGESPLLEAMNLHFLWVPWITNLARCSIILKALWKGSASHLIHQITSGEVTDKPWQLDISKRAEGKVSINPGVPCAEACSTERQFSCHCQSLSHMPRRRPVFGWLCVAYSHSTAQGLFCAGQSSVWIFERYCSVCKGRGTEVPHPQWACSQCNEQIHEALSVPLWVVHRISI